MLRTTHFLFEAHGWTPCPKGKRQPSDRLRASVCFIAAPPGSSGLMQPSRVNWKSPFENAGPTSLKDPGSMNHSLKGEQVTIRSILSETKQASIQCYPSEIWGLSFTPERKMSPHSFLISCLYNLAFWSIVLQFSKIFEWSLGDRNDDDNFSIPGSF